MAGRRGTLRSEWGGLTCGAGTTSGTVLGQLKEGNHREGPQPWRAQLKTAPVDMRQEGAKSCLWNGLERAMR